MKDVYDLNLDILDRQLIDSAGVACGNVDDIELTFTDPDESPIVTAILVGPGALGPRIGGLLGRVITGIWRVFHPGAEPEPIRVEWKHVVLVDYAVHLSVEAEEAGLLRGEHWVRDRLVGKIPGS